MTAAARSRNAARAWGSGGSAAPDGARPRAGCGAVRPRCRARCAGATARDAASVLVAGCGGAARRWRRRADGQDVDEVLTHRRQPVQCGEGRSRPCASENATGDRGRARRGEQRRRQTSVRQPMRGRQGVSVPGAKEQAERDHDCDFGTTQPNLNALFDVTGRDKHGSKGSKARQFGPRKGRLKEAPGRLKFLHLDGGRAGAARPGAYQGSAGPAPSFLDPHGGRAGRSPAWLSDRPVHLLALRGVVPPRRGGGPTHEVGGGHEGVQHALAGPGACRWRGTAPGRAGEGVTRTQFVGLADAQSPQVGGQARRCWAVAPAPGSRRRWRPWAT